MSSALGGVSHEEHLGQVRQNCNEKSPSGALVTRAANWKTGKNSYTNT